MKSLILFLSLILIGLNVRAQPVEWAHLPLDVKLIIFSSLKPGERARLARTSKEFKRLATDLRFKLSPSAGFNLGRALDEALESGSSETIQKLVAQWETSRLNGESSPLVRAMRKGNVQAAKMILKFMFEQDPNLLAGQNGQTTALHRAVLSGNLEFVKKVIHRVNRDSRHLQDEDGKTPLDLAIEKTVGRPMYGRSDGEYVIQGYELNHNFYEIVRYLLRKLSQGALEQRSPMPFKPEVNDSVIQTIIPYLPREAYLERYTTEEVSSESGMLISWLKYRFPQLFQEWIKNSSWQFFVSNRSHINLLETAVLWDRDSFQLVLNRIPEDQRGFYLRKIGGPWGASPLQKAYFWYDGKENWDLIAPYLNAETVFAPDHLGRTIFQHSICRSDEIFETYLAMNPPKEVLLAKTKLGESLLSRVVTCGTLNRLQLILAAAPELLKLHDPAELAKELERNTRRNALDSDRRREALKMAQYLKDYLKPANVLAEQK